MKERRIIPYALILVMLVALCFLIHCLNRDTWFDDGEKYLCPECKYLEYYDYGAYCERCQESIPYSPVDYCYQCAKELDICQRCGRER
jgi:hypothetical protein